MAIEPISPALDEDLFIIVAAKELGMSVDEFENSPSRERWTSRLHQKWAWEDVERKMASKMRPKK